MQNCFHNLFREKKLGVGVTTLGFLQGSQYRIQISFEVVGLPPSLTCHKTLEGIWTLLNSI